MLYILADSDIIPISSFKEVMRDVLLYNIFPREKAMQDVMLLT